MVNHDFTCGEFNYNIFTSKIRRTTTRFLKWIKKLSSIRILSPKITFLPNWMKSLDPVWVCKLHLFNKEKDTSCRQNSETSFEKEAELRVLCLFFSMWPLQTLPPKWCHVKRNVLYRKSCNLIFILVSILTEKKTASHGKIKRKLINFNKEKIFSNQINNVI